MFKVLLVDDEPRMLESLLTMFPWEEYGFLVAGSVPDGIAACAFLQHEQVDVLVTDIRMPNMDGLALIQHVSGKYPAMKTVILSAHDEFSYVKEAIGYGVENYILKPVNRNELLETMLKISEKLEDRSGNRFSPSQTGAFKDNLVRRWISGAIEPNELMERAPLAELPLQCGAYRVILVRVLGTTGDVYVKSLIEQVKTLFFPIYSGWCFAESGDQAVILLAAHAALPAQTIKGILAALIQQIGNHARPGLFLTIGTEVDSPRNVGYSYHTARKLQDYSLLMSNDSIISYEEVSGWSLDCPLPERFNLMEFERLLTEYCDTEAYELLMKTLARGDGFSPLSLHYQQYAISEAMLRISMLIRRMNVPYELIPATLTNLNEQAESISSRDQLHAWLHQVVFDTVHLLRGGMSQKSPVISSIVSFLSQNYTDAELSLKTIAARFHMNPSYLGQLFKAEMGEYFSAYLNQIRIDKAAVLLLNPRIKTGEVSEKVGYNSTSYFHKMFFRMTGCTPSEYRGKCGKAGQSD